MAAEQVSPGYRASQDGQGRSRFRIKAVDDGAQPWPVMYILAADEVEATAFYAEQNYGSSEYDIVTLSD